MRTSVRIFCAIVSFTALSCRESPPEEGVNDGEGEELTAPELSGVAEWQFRIEAAADDPERRDWLLFQMTRDGSLDPYEALECLVNSDADEGTIVGGAVAIMRRVMEVDAVAAARCWELVRNIPRTDALFHGLGRELGRQAPEFGLEWLSAQPRSKSLYFAAVNLGDGFAQYAENGDLEKVEAIFGSFLDAPLFDGSSCEKGDKGAGPRMRERMTDGVLEGLGRSGRLDEGLRSRLCEKVPAKCVPHLESHVVYGWPEERVEREFDDRIFSEAARPSAVRIGLMRIVPLTTMDEAFRWSESVSEPRTRSWAENTIIQFHVRRAEEDEIVGILESLEDHAHFETGLAWARFRAMESEDPSLVEKIEGVRKRR